MFWYFDKHNIFGILINIILYIIFCGISINIIFYIIYGIVINILFYIIFLHFDKLNIVYYIWHIY